MSLHDEHLKTALKYAPDKDAAPKAQVRATILDYANKAIQPKSGHHLTTYLQNLFAHWQWANLKWIGAGSFAGILLVMLVMHQLTPDDTAWMAATPEKPKNDFKIAQNKSDHSEQKASLASPAVQALPAGESRKFEPTDGLAKQEVMKVAPLAVVKKDIPNTDTLKEDRMKQAESVDNMAAEVPQIVASAAPLAKEAIELSDKALPDAAVAAPPAAAEIAESSAQYNADDASVAERKMPTNTRADSVAPARAESLRLAKKEKMDIKENLAQALINEGGDAVAKRDIQSEKLRLLSIATYKDLADCLNPSSHTYQLDKQTGYPIEIIDVCDTDTERLTSEVGTYNQAMKNWYLISH